MRLATVATCALLLTPALALAGTSSGTGTTRTATTKHTIQGQKVSVYNIAGKMEVVTGTGSSVVVEVTPQGRDAGRLSVKETTIKGLPSLRVVYPENDIVYPEYGYGPPNGVRTESFSGDEHRRYRVTGSGPGLEAHADIRVLVPRGKSVDLHLLVGQASVTDVQGDVSFEGASSDVVIAGVSGALSVDTGSGSIKVSKSKGKISIDTGSGDIEISESQGEVSVEAGSGSITLQGVGGGAIHASAGSGAVSGSNVRATELHADAGSGEVDLDGVSADKMSIDTGSGTIRVRLLENVGDLQIDGGSGSVTLQAPQDLSAEVKIECGKRHLKIDFPITIVSQDDDVTIGRIGSGKGRIVIDSGSGSVKLIRL